MAQLALIATVASAAVGVIGGVMQYQAGRQDARALEQQAAYNAAVANNQAAMDEYNAQLAEADAETARGNMEETGWAAQMALYDQDLQAREQIGRERAAIATTGLTGHSMARRIDTLELLAARDRSRLRQIGNTEVAGFRQQESDLLVEAQNTRQGAKSLRADARMMRRNASQAASSIRMGANSSLLSGFTSAAGSLLDGSRSPTVRRQFGNLRSSLTRRG